MTSRSSAIDEPEEVEPPVVSEPDARCHAVLGGEATRPFPTDACVADRVELCSKIRIDHDSPLVVIPAECGLRANVTEDVEGAHPPAVIGVGA
jgi:hypothetical protein